MPPEDYLRCVLIFGTLEQVLMLSAMAYLINTGNSATALLESFSSSSFIISKIEHGWHPFKLRSALPNAVLFVFSSLC